MDLPTDIFTDIFNLEEIQRQWELEESILDRQQELLEELQRRNNRSHKRKSISRDLVRKCKKERVTMAVTVESYTLDGGVVNGGNGHATPCMLAIKEQSSIQSQRYYLSRKTIFEMLKDRGYDIADSDLTLSLPEFVASFGNDPHLESLRIRASLRSDFCKKILVVFMGTDEIRTAHIRALYGQVMGTESLDRMILVLQNKINSFARKELEKYPFKVEIFQITDFLANVTKHVLQPNIQILTNEQKQQLLEKYKLEDKQLPVMLTTDAIARHYGLEKGQVVRVTYNDGVAGSLVTYRYVK